MTTNQKNNIERRTVRSFVRRSGRITKRQRAAYRRLYEKFGIRAGEQTLEGEKLFGREAPLILEIGFGMGESTAKIAEQHPQNDYLAIEVHRAGIGNLIELLEAKNLPNVRIIEHDAIDVLQNHLADGSLAAIHIYFPDPWPKKRHHKRRLIKPDTTKLFCQKLKSGGYIHAATDWQEYAEEILAIFSEEALLQNTAQGFATKPSWRPRTKFERRASREKRLSFDILFKRR